MRLTRTFSGRRRWPVAIGAALVLGLVVVAVRLLTAGGSSPAPTVDRTAQPGDADLTAITAVLDRHGSALFHRDRSVWLADLDTSDPAAGYRTSQTSLFDNIAHVPLTLWKYEIVSPVLTPDAIEAASARLNARVVIVKVRVDYGLKNVDPEPTERNAWITFALRGHDWRMAGDSDVAEQAGVSWKGPWDFGPVVVHQSAHVLVLSHPAHESLAAPFADLVEASIPGVDQVWGTDWNHSVALEIPDDEAEFTSVAGASPETDTLAAVTTVDSVDPIGRTVLGARMVLNPQTLSQLSPDGRRLVVQHELTHIATANTATDQMPTWLVEGFADYVANTAVAQPVTVAAAELARQVRAGQVPSSLPGGDDFAAATSSLNVLYEEAWMACRLIASQHGQAGLVRFYRAVAKLSDTEPENATTDAFRTVLHTTEPAFVRSWRAELVAELGR